MKTAKELLNFGRIDIIGDDGVWLDNGLTENGLIALKAIENRDMALHLIRPSKKSLSAVLDSTAYPFLISEFDDYNEELIANIKKNDVLIAIDFDSAGIDLTLEHLKLYKEKFDTTSNILLNVTSLDGVGYAQKELYLKLIEEGWTKKEIYSIGGLGTSRRGSGNLDILPGGRPRFPVW